MPLALVLVAALACTDPSTPVTQPTHTRSLTRIAQGVVNDAVRASPTIESMIAAIERTDVIVYVDAKLSPLSSWRGDTQFVGASATARFVTVTINLALEPNQRAEVLAHELQHVLEIAQASQVRDSAGMKLLFERIGWGHDQAFETAAAIDVERAVHQEVWDGRARQHAAARNGTARPPRR